MRLLMTGQPIGAAEALQIGLVSEVHADALVEECALQRAVQLAALPALALRFIKEAVLESMSSTLERGLQHERKSFQLLFATPDKTEGIRARLEKRTPQFQGAASLQP